MEQPIQLSIGIDDRELRSLTARRLYELGCVLDSKRLAVGDYVLSDRCCVERKNDSDLEASIIDGRLFSQACELCGCYSAPVLAVVGSNFTRLNPKAVKAALASLAVDFRIPSFFFSSEEEFADFLLVLATREAAVGRREPRLQTEKKEVPDSQLQQLIVESLPSVGPIHAKALLCHFGSVREIFCAQHDDLVKVEGIGKGRAKRMRGIIDGKYAP